VVTVIRGLRKSPVLTSSGLACLSKLPTINLTTGCLHDCLYCYIRGYRNYPGEGRIVLYENTLELLRDELGRVAVKPRAVYFSPSSDLFQPAPEVLELSHAILQFLFSQGIGVAFLTKGVIPDCTLRLLIEHRELVQAQIGLITLDEGISRVFEPHAATPRRRLHQLGTLVAAGVQTQARLDPILPGVTDSPDSLDEHMASLVAIGVTRIAAGVLFLRAGILYWLKSRVSDRRMLESLLHAYQGGQQTVMRGAQYPILNLSTEARCEIFERLGQAAAAHGIEVKICACKNADLARGSCNIAGTWPQRSADVVQPALAVV
jgi:DNA repair photolyase